jgi:hypothetical protein
MPCRLVDVICASEEPVGSSFTAHEPHRITEDGVRSSPCVTWLNEARQPLPNIGDQPVASTFKEQEIGNIITIGVSHTHLEIYDGVYCGIYLRTLLRKQLIQSSGRRWILQGCLKSWYCKLHDYARGDFRWLSTVTPDIVHPSAPAPPPQTHLQIRALYLQNAHWPS